MLEYLSIKNFALIEDLQIHFSSNFNVLTGETGTGKSIIIDALSLLLGGRAQAEYIRTGTEKALVEGVFSLPAGDPFWKQIDEWDLRNEDRTLILSREISLNGRNICRINGRILTLAQYRQIGLALVDIHGQHAHQSLLQEDKHRQLLDSFGGPEHLQFLSKVKELYQEYVALQKEWEALKLSEKERLQKIDFLQYQLNEIKGARIQKGEMEELAREVNILANAEKISASLAKAYEALFSGDRGNSAYDLAGKAISNLREIEHLDGSFKQLLSQLEPVLYMLEDGASQIKNYLEEMDYSPERLEESEKRLHFLQDLCKKYGADLEEVLAYAEKISAELEQLHSSSERGGQLALNCEKKQAEYQAQAESLSSKRKELGRKLEEQVTAQLIELAMPHVRFAVSTIPTPPAAYGLEQVAFLICPNPGEPLLPVAKIASGGELSRIMLALKTILAKIDGVGTMVFDEIDAGIGGQAAQKVAEKLAEISASQQVICVTHSPLIAALADHHLVIQKEVTPAGRTLTKVFELREKERIDELARMFGGENPSGDLKKYAEKILKRN
ncbi:MAG TPA: DNA repair protein RecN [Peptococcaceae bacterium]|jgi:DNA repair protein RecN (Recombination protein N)|nr:DNA repair protein RecN [Peptococcaceae bacterium]HPZ71033.1 DNA repair protein RecN [Peptococcaceae bacterium]HQD53591.1 DNA repair protein RecN [Peptococcaceae bacterium]